MVVLFKQFILWRILSVMLCPNLMTMFAKWRYDALTQVITTIQKMLLLINLPQKQRNQFQMLRQLWKNKNNWINQRYSINYPYFPKLFNFFVVKLKLLRKASGFLPLGETNIMLVLRFLKSNKFYYP